MPIQFDCDNCGKQIRVPDDKAGKRGKCPQCGTMVTVPSDIADAIPIESDPMPFPSRASTGTAARARAAAAIPEVDDEIPEPEPIEEDDEFNRIMSEIDDEETSVSDGSPSAAAAARRTRTRGRAGVAGEEERTGAVKSRYQQLAEKRQKKGGGFFWVIFGFLLAVLHTAAGVAAGIVLTVGYLEDRAAGNESEAIIYPVLAPLGFDKRIDDAAPRAGDRGAAEGPEDEDGEGTNESEPISTQGGSE